VGSLDWAVLGSYLVVILIVGFVAGRKTQGLTDFFLAGRRMPWWAVGLSVMATQVSAITFVGTTGQAYTDGMRFLVVYLGLPFALVILCATLVPFFYRSGVFTAYEALERRFDRRTRTLTSLLFLASRGLSVGVTLYAPALVLSVILGWSESWTVLLMAGSAIAYVIYGGNRSVIWTDVVQMGVIWFGILVCVATALGKLPPEVHLRDALALAQTTGRLRIMDTTPSLEKPYTLWSGLLGGLFLMLSYFGCDQSQVQRYLSGRSLTESRLSLIFNAFLKIPMQFLVLLTGILVFVFYHFQQPPLLWSPTALRSLEARGEGPLLEERYRQAFLTRREAASRFVAERHGGGSPDPGPYLMADQEMGRLRSEAVRSLVGPGGSLSDTNYIFPSYVVRELPRGLAGLVIAVIFAAAMTALSGELSALATASMVDFYSRIKVPLLAGRDLLVSRILTGLWGAFACFVALHAGKLGSAIEVVNRLGSLFYGSILGVFFLVFTPGAGASGAFYGLLTGLVTVLLVSRFTPVHFLWWNLIGALVVWVTGVVLSRLQGEPRPRP
jgi:Na+/proline symporter